ncbi:hypothetical protein HAX54_016997 [Datura stramonium]|uniref:Wall-associated receptor kinase galacturonan-binding domain-containing protein n=1 Tax=Datura stramonium TaxID=4076 RepID=A0ABS8UM57_DATST|nr:hypothetical protein [Datura stramonium]
MSKGGTSLLKYFTLILICIFLHTCNARKSKHYCIPSACGHIRNISYPFYLNTDPQYCRDHPAIELACEGNQTVISLEFSNKLYVQSINYDNRTLRLVDPTYKHKMGCSLAPQLNFPDTIVSFPHMIIILMDMLKE